MDQIQMIALRIADLRDICGMTQEEYDEMYQRIRAELIEELMRCGAIPQKTE